MQLLLEMLPQRGHISPCDIAKRTRRLVRQLKAELDQSSMPKRRQDGWLLIQVGQRVLEAALGRVESIRFREPIPERLDVSPG